MLDLELRNLALASPSPTRAECRHDQEAEHNPPYHSDEAIEYPDGCRFQPVYDGCYLVSRTQVFA